MKKIFFCLLFFISANIRFVSADTLVAPVKFFAANNPFIEYTGRIDFSDPLKPKFWSSGVYVKFRFKGTGCEITVNDEMLYGNSHNYIEIVVDDQKPYRLQTTELIDKFKIGGQLANDEHTITICKDTEAGIGYLEFVGVKCEKLLKPLHRPKHKMEFIGTSITCAADMDRSLYPCNFGDWYAHHNAYMSYGALTARALKSDWQIAAISGIGLTNSCCKIPVMPEAYDKVNMRNDSLRWNFNTYQADLVSICLGESDGIAAQDSASFCAAYVAFIGDVRRYYPKANIICLSIPTTDTRMNGSFKKYMVGIADYMKAHGDNKVYPFTVSKIYAAGCNNHPDLGDHQLIADELVDFIQKTFKWGEPQAGKRFLSRIKNGL